jgi:non-specific serine/threonine protein kinase
LSNLPTELSSFIGRKREITAVRQLLQTTRLLTLIGAGGVGKTRLALRVMSEVAHSYADGVWVVDLAPVADPTLVPKAVASALDVQEQPGRALHDTLADAVRRRALLLLFDNCEHLVQSCAELTEVLLGACPRLCIMATSRQALRIAGETVWRVPSLQMPELVDAAAVVRVSHTEAVQLFVERARAAQPAFVLSDLNVSAVVQVCHQLDGIPLALELAAARLSALSAEQIAARLDDRFMLLTEGSRTALSRQQTLRSMLDWSHALLSGRERVLLRRLAVFAGGWTLEAAEVVCADETLQASEILDLLAQLVGKSLVVADAQGEKVRYWLLETMRQYAWEHLRTAGEEEHMRRRHAAWCVALSEEAQPRLYRTEQVQWLEQLEREHDNLRLALAWSHAQPNGSIRVARLARALWWFWYLHGHLNEGRYWLDLVVLLPEPASAGVGVATELALARAGALLGAGWLAYGNAELERAGQLLEQSAARARECGDRQTTAQALMGLSFTLRDRGQLQRSRTLLDESLALARATGFRWGEAFSLYLMGNAAALQGDFAEVPVLCGQSLRLFQELGERLGTAYALNELARNAFDRHEDELATELYQQGLVLSRELGNRRGICFGLDGLARGARERSELVRAESLLREEMVLWRDLGNRFHQAFVMTRLAALAAEQHQARRAACLFGAAEAQFEYVGTTTPRWLRDFAAYDQATATACQELGAGAFADLWAAGRAMSREAAIDEALAFEGPPATPSKGAHAAGLGRLSPREREVAVLVAEGRSNNEIGTALVIATRTADTHVGHILNKLGLHRRAQIAAWVVEHGLARTEAGRFET